MHALVELLKRLNSINSPGTEYHEKLPFAIRVLKNNVPKSRWGLFQDCVTMTERLVIYNIIVSHHACRLLPLYIQPGCKAQKKKRTINFNLIFFLSCLAF